jgi:hypothetical protein
MIQFECPGCGAAYSVDDTKAGKTGQCPKCQSQFVIPHAAADGPPPLPANPNAPVEVSPCPGCQVRLSVAPADLGSDVECPYCKTVFRAEAPGSVNDGPRDRHDDESRDQPSRRRRPPQDDADDGHQPRRSRKPGEIAVLGGMLLGGGIYALVQSAGLAFGSAFICCLWPGIYLALVWGILAIIRGSQMLGKNDLQGPPRTLLILQILMILNADVINCVLGIVGLTLLNNPAVRDYYERRRGFED